eukprot:c45937_g1_i1.p1 GENE.c45937_g1_i1~~c45937_g1_i1.p1  ORF type:complete len:276 (-),score=28.23 c45937_g1_i1:110-937(-)
MLGLSTSAVMSASVYPSTSSSSLMVSPSEASNRKKRTLDERSPRELRDVTPSAEQVVSPRLKRAKSMEDINSLSSGFSQPASLESHGLSVDTSESSMSSVPSALTACYRSEVHGSRTRGGSSVLCRSPASPGTYYQQRWLPGFSMEANITFDIIEASPPPSRTASVHAFAQEDRLFFGTAAPFTSGRYDDGSDYSDSDSDSEGPASMSCDDELNDEPAPALPRLASFSPPPLAAGGEAVHKALQKLRLEDSMPSERHPRLLGMAEMGAVAGMVVS